jgi:hypothetical protein
VLSGAPRSFSGIASVGKPRGKGALLVSAGPPGDTWAAERRFECYGARIGIRTNEPAVLPAMVGRLPVTATQTAPGVVDDLFSIRLDAEPGTHELCDRDGCVLLTSDLDRLLDVFESRLELSVAIEADVGVFVHAGAVGVDDRAIVIPGASMSGKSTLVAGLVEAGASYLSDEFAVLDGRGVVHPYPCPLSRRHPDGTSSTLPPEELGTLGTVPLPVGFVVFTGYRTGAKWDPEVLSPGGALLGLMSNTPAARTRPDWVLRTLGATASRAVAFRTPRGDAGRSAARLLDHVSSAAAG